MMGCVKWREWVIYGRGLNKKGIPNCYRRSELALGNRRRQAKSSQRVRYRGHENLWASLLWLVFFITGPLLIEHFVIFYDSD